MREVSFFVAGTPRPQGSKKAVMGLHQKFPSVVESAGQALKDWRADVRYTAAKLGLSFSGAVYVELLFHLTRPKSHYGTGRNSDVLKPSAPKHHIQKPDADKLTRAVFDALTGVLYSDDSCVVKHTVEKTWTDRSRPSGCWIMVRQIEGNDE